MFQNLAWQPDPGAADTVSPPVDRWLVLGRAPLAEAVTRAGLDAACLEHDPQLHRTLEALSRAPRAGVLFAEGLDEELDAVAQVDRALRWATLVRAAQDAGAPLWLITRRAVLLPGDTRAVSPSAALLLALGRAAFAEHATLLGGVLDVPDDVDWLPRALGAPSRQSAAWRQGVRHTERRVTATLAPADGRPAANVLIIGGLGGLGSALAARWAAAGSRLVLVGRGGPPPLPHHEYHPVDVRDRAAMQRVFAGRRFDRVVHAAGELHVGSLVRTARDAFERVFAPKVEGTLALAALLEGTSTQVLLLTSTAGALEGQQGGVGAYAAANAFQDAFAHRQRQLGLPWSSICLPSIRGVGLSARLEGAASAHAAAVPSLSLDEALVAIDATLANPSAQVIVAADTPSPTSAPPEARPLAPQAVLRAELEPTLRALLARETNQPADAIDPHRTFQSFGIDSLGALDLIRSLEEQLGMRLSDTLMFEHDTLDKLLTALSTGQGAPRAKASAPAAAAPSAAAELPVLPAQKTFYANQRFFPHLPAYVFLRADLKGPVDAELVAAGVEVLFRRHPMLRVTFELRDGVLLQREGGFAAPALVQREAAAGELDAVEADFRNQTFSLEHGPLFQFALIRTAPAQATLMLHVHHIVADAWSGQLLLLELLELHRRGSEGLALELPELATSFSDCVRAFEARSDDARDSRAWWRQTLENPPPRLKLPFDSDPDAVPQGPCHLHQVELDAATTGALLERAKQSSCSMFELVFAAYASCLREWSGQSELLVRVAQARRDARLPDVDRVVGCFADSLPLRLSVDADLAVLLRRVREASLAAQQHGLTSSLELAGLGAERSPGGPRGLTPAGFSFPDFKAPERFGAVEIAAVRAGAATGFTQLGLIAWQFRGKLHLSWNFTGALFRPETVRRLSAELQARLRSLAAQRRAPLPQGAVVPARIDASLEAAGDRVVLVTPAERVTARALRQRAEALSRALAEEGAAPNRLVVVLARPGVEATVAVLGVLGSGAAYVPIDPDYPDARVAQLALHSGAELLVTTRDQLSRLRALPELNARLRRVLLVDGVATDEGPHLRTWPQILEATGRPRLAAPADLAYVMYTSGTTAEPKGVCVTHAAVSLFHDWVHDAFEVTSNDAFIQTSSLSFGGSIRQIYSPLLAGACLYPAPLGLTKDPLALAAFLDDHGITVWNSVPSLWRRLLDSIQAQAPERRPKLERLRWVLIGGEQVPATLVHEWRALYGHRHRIANLYGSTETVVNATAFEVPQGFDGRGQVPIGRARAGSQVRLLDDALQPVGAGETGELYVGGPSVSSGYHRAPELTRAAFVEVPGERGPFYRTGDLARRSPEGELQFLGRADTQVKVRGNRVELAEIEAALESLPQVKAAVVVERREGEQQWLVAHVQLRDEGAALDAAALRAGVAARLPAFMVPHRFEKATVFPLTPAGKVDRRALAARPSAQPVADEPTSAASWSNTEQVVARVWSETLRLTSVERSDDFFGLGGDSLIALDMLARLEKQLGAMPPPVTLYSARTVEQLAKAIDAQSRPAPPAARAAAPTDAPFSLAPTQVGFLLAERAGAGAAPVWCADLPGRGALDRARFTAALQSVVDRHPMLRVVFERHGLKTLQRVCPTVTLPLEWHDVSALPPPEQARRIDAHFARRCAQPFDLAAGPGWSLALFVTGKGTFRCLIAVHHAVGDGWSVQLFGAELLAAYDGAAAREPLRAGFRDVVEHQLKLARSDFSAGLAFWQQQLEGLPPPVALAAHDTGTVSLELPPAATAALRARARAERTTLHDLVLTAFFRALRVETGQADLVVGTAISGRELPVPDVAEMFGCFARALPVRAQVSGGDARADLQRVSAAFHAASAHADVPLERVASVVKRESGAPLPGAAFFFSLMDFRALPQVQGRTLRFDLGDARLHFGATALGTQLMLGVLAGEALRLNAHGAAASAVKQRVLAAVAAELAAAPRAAVRVQAAGTLDAGLVAYLPSAATLERALGTIDRDAVRSMLFPDGRPRLLETVATRSGSSGVVLLPHFAEELSAMPGEAVARITASAVEIARQAGARAVSLAGMLPSWTGYGFAVDRALGGGAPVTTGHAATVVAMAKTVERLLSTGGSRLAQLDVAVVGFGSIGQAALRLVLDVLGLPRSVTVFERAAQLPRLASLLEGLEERLGEPVRAIAADDGLPAELYACDLVLGASSQGGLVDVERLKPGACVVDDSLPSLADPARAWARMRRATDTVVADGGKLDFGDVGRTVHLPGLEGGLPSGLDTFFSVGMPGCRAESLLIAADPSLKASCGLVDPRRALAFWRAAERGGIEAAPLSLAGQPLAPERVEATFAHLRARVPR